MPKVWNINDPKCPANARYVGRGSPTGNPFKIGVDRNRVEVCQKFKEWVEANPEVRRRIVAYCKGHDLKCFCKPKPCHGDYCLEISDKKNVLI